MATYKLQIQSPCHENWATMTPTERGAFCMACQKEVIDFTNKSYADIAKTLNTKKGENVCARFTKQQTEFEFEYKPVLTANSWLKRGFVGAVLSLLVAAVTANAQTTPVKHKTEVVAKSTKGKLVYTGRVVKDTLNAPIANVSVFLTSNPSIGTVTDSLGRFKIIVDKTVCHDSLFSFNYLACEPLVAKLQPGVDQFVELKPHIFQLESMEITAETNPYEWRTTTVGLLPTIRYDIQVRQTGVSIGMAIRHFFGISYWD